MAHPVGDRPTETERRDRIALAVILIVIGIGSLVGQAAKAAPEFGGWFLALFGAGLLAAFVYSRVYGFLIPAGIMTGLGLGLAASEALPLATDDETGGVIVLGLGLGFLSIYAIGALARVPENHWWPFVPGGILTAVGAALVIGPQAVDLLEYWGVILVALGLVVLWRVARTGRTGS